MEVGCCCVWPACNHRGSPAQTLRGIHACTDRLEYVFADIIYIVYTFVAMHSLWNECSFLRFIASASFSPARGSFFPFIPPLSCTSPTSKSPAVLMFGLNGAIVSFPRSYYVFPVLTASPGLPFLSPPTPVMTRLFSSSPDVLTVQVRPVSQNHHARLRRPIHILFFTSLCF